MRSSLSFLCALVLVASSRAAMAGPNMYGTLVVHDAAISFSVAADLVTPPESEEPADCPSVDNNARRAMAPTSACGRSMRPFR
jgi:hypothetical protein